MTTRPRVHALRRLGVALLALVFLCSPAPSTVLSSALPTAQAAPAGADPGTRAGDRDLGEADCSLLGRDYTAGLGCSRTRCVDGAVLWRKTYGAEACALRGAPQGYGFVATVDARTCEALHRRWIAQVNYCASEPDRGRTAIYGAAQCTAPATVYVPLSETDGAFDECLTQERADELSRLAADEHVLLTDEVFKHSAVQCPARPGHVLVNGSCVADPGFEPSGGGVLMVGDSLTWRGTDELQRLRPTFTLDGEPARPPTELAARLAAYRIGHGDPTGLIIELGTVPARSFARRDLVKVVRSLPRATQVMFVLPHYELRSDPVVVTPQSKKVGGWMRQLARSRPSSCAADWPAYVRAHAGILQDGVHTRHAAEGQWARWVDRQWERC